MAHGVWAAAAWLLMTSSISHAAVTDGLYISNGTDLLFAANPEHGDIISAFHQNNGNIVGVAVDSGTHQIFWSDISFGNRGIYSGTIQDDNTINKVVRVVSARDCGEANGLTVDWVTQNLYWTDERTGALHVANYQGSNQRRLVNTGLQRLRAVLSDPSNGYLYWNAQTPGVVQRARPDGTGVHAFVSNISYPNQMAALNGMLYLVDAASRTVWQVDPSGKKQLVAPLVDTVGSHYVFGLVAAPGLLYISVWTSGQLLKVNLNTKVVTVLHENLGVDKMFSLAFHDATIQKPGINPCTASGLTCSHLCLPTGRQTARCACPSLGGIVIQGSSCSPPTRILLYTAADSKEVGYVAMDRQGQPSADRYLVARSERPVALAYDAQHQVVYWSDVFEQRIMSVNLDGSDRRVLLQGYNNSIGTVDGLFLDAKNGYLYYTNMGSTEVDGMSYAWHKIDMISITTLQVRTVVFSAQKPRGLWVDSAAGYLYYTDWGNKAAVIRVNLDGSDPHVIHDSLNNPNAVIVDNNNNKLFVLDSNYKTRKSENVNLDYTARNGSVYMAGRTGGGWREVTGLNLGTPFGMTHNADRDELYISDWDSSSVVRVIVGSGGRATVTPLLAGLASPMAVLYTNRTQPAPGVSACAASNCAGMCVTGPSASTTCTCSSYTAATLHTTCTVPKNYMVFADMTYIGLVDLDGPDRTVHTLVNGSGYLSNFVALALDEANQGVYYSDVNRREIRYTSLNGSQRHLVYETPRQVVDGLAYSATKRRLYWTDYLTGAIYWLDVARSNVNATIFLSDLGRPRGVAVDDTNSYLYWTEWSSTEPRVTRAPLDNPHAQDSLLTRRDVTRPNGVSLDVPKNKMYVGEAVDRKVMQCDLDGFNCKALLYMSGVPDHIYDVFKISNVLFYSDWRKGAIQRVTMETGNVETVAANLVRPSQMALHISTPSVCPLSHGCGDTCLPVPGGYECVCRPGRYLQQDHLSCGPRAVWMSSDSARCEVSCDARSLCMRQLGTVTFDCRCREGFQSSSTGCVVCGANQYKSAAGATSCTNCAAGTSVAPNGTACVCVGGKYWDWMNNTCQDVKVGECPPGGAAQGGTCGATCQHDGTCSGTRKCCDVSGCGGKRCVDPIVSYKCSYKGQLYNIGEEFHPDVCRKCQCSRSSQGAPRADCATIDCPVLSCETTRHIKQTDSCCPECRAQNDTSDTLTVTNCPQNGDVVNIHTPENDDVAKDGFMPQVDDKLFRAKRRVIIQRYPAARFYKYTEDTVTVLWKVSSYNPNGYNDTASCSYRLQVIDDIAPTITCPGMVKIYIGDSTKQVMGEWPEPLVHDNVGIEDGFPRQTKGPSWGDMLSLGQHEVTYEVQDRAHHTAQCSFEIIIVRTGFGRCGIMHPNHGLLDCKPSDAWPGLSCRLQCAPGYAPRDEGEFACNTRGDQAVWKPQPPEDFTQLACVRNVSMSVVSTVTASVSSCPPGKVNYGEAEAQLKSQVEEVVQAQDNEISDRTGVTVDYRTVCDRVTAATPTLSATAGSQPQPIHVQMSLIVSDVVFSDRESVQNQLNSVAQLIEKDIEEGNIGLLPRCLSCVADDVGALAGLAVSHTAASPQCLPGQQESAPTCFACPVGTHYDAGGGLCRLCPENEYQDRESSLHCVTCPSGLYSAPGSYTRRQCVGEPIHKAQTGGSPDVVTLVIGVVVVVIVLTIIIIVVVVVLRRSRKRTLARDDFHTPLSMHNPVYEGGTVTEDAMYDDTVHQPQGAMGFTPPEGAGVYEDLNEFSSGKVIGEDGLPPKPGMDDVYANEGFAQENVYAEAEESGAEKEKGKESASEEKVNLGNDYTTSPFK